MRHLGVLLFAVVLFSNVKCFGNGDSLQYLLPTDTVITQLHPMGEIMLSHQMEPKQTLYSLAKFYGMSLGELYAYNPHISLSYGPGDILQIPIPLRSVIRKTPPVALAANLAKVYYKVRRGDTMYGLTNRIFNISEDSLLLRNPELAGGLHSGQLLFIGWMATQPIPEAWRTIRGGPYARMNHTMKLEYFRRSASKRIRETSGAATWPKDMESTSGFYCMHPTAPINSIVEVHNPLTHQTMYLKVVAKMPEGVYGRNVKIVVSPLAVKALGALDDQFYVTIKHY